MHNWVIDRVDEMGAAEGSPNIKNVINMFPEPDFNNNSYPEDIDEYGADVDDSDSTCVLSMSEDNRILH